MKKEEKELIEQKVANYIDGNLSLSDEVSVEFDADEEELNISGGLWKVKISTNEYFYLFSFKAVVDNLYMSEDDLDDLCQIRDNYHDIIDAAFENDDGEFDDEC